MTFLDIYDFVDFPVKLTFFLSRSSVCARKTSTEGGGALIGPTRLREID